MATLTITSKGNFVLRMHEHDHIEIIIETKTDDKRKVLHVNTDEQSNCTASLVPYHKKPAP